MKRIALILAASFMMLSICSCGQTSGEEPPAKQERPNIHATVDEFVAKYNEMSAVDISDLSVININDKEGGHYRVEFRLTAFEDARSKTGKVGDGSIDIINYGSLSPDGLRVYVAPTSFEEMQQIFAPMAMALDPGITEEDIQQIYSKIESGGSSFVVGNLTGTYGLEGECSFMLDDARYIQHMED